MRNWLFLLGMLILLTGCFGGGSEETAVTNLGHETEIARGSATVLTCGLDCAQRGQCGEDGEGNKFVLGGSDQPIVELGTHNRSLPTDQEVTVQDMTNLAVREIQSSNMLFVNFYNVQLTSDPNKTAWVAGWCVAVP